MSLNEIVKTMQDAVNRQAEQATPGGYDTTATVRRIEDGVAWVHIPGGIDETPVKLTINAKQGDNVQVRVSGGNAFLVGNGSAPPTDDARANQAYTVATVAEGAAENALANASRAKEAADSAQSAATRAESAAGDAVIAAGNAQTAAGNAQTAADNALVSLSTVEDVVGILTWITEHGTMTTQAGGTFVPGQVYFIADPAGDYYVGGNYYSVVPEPRAADIDSYYVLTVDESVQNYVATHIVVDTEGLWIIPDSGGNKVLIATGAGSTYTTAGTYIVGKVGGVDTVLASFTASGAQIGIDDNSHVSIKPNGIDFFAKENAPIGTVSTQEPLTRTITSEDYSPYGEQEEEKICYAYITDSVSDNLLRISASVTRYRQEESSVIIDELPFETATHTYTVMSGEELFGATLEVYIDNHNRSVIFTFTDTTGANNLVAAYGRVQYTNIYSPVKTVFGKISDQQEYGNYSVALCSSIAKGDNQVTCGKYNDVDENNEYAFIVGGGTDERSRENIFDLDWDGNVWAAGDISAPTGTVSGDKGMFYDSLETSGDINISGQYHYKINGTALSAENVGAAKASWTSLGSKTGNTQSLTVPNTAKEVYVLVHAGSGYYQGIFPVGIATNTRAVLGGYYYSSSDYGTCTLDISNSNKTYKIRNVTYGGANRNDSATIYVYYR